MSGLTASPTSTPSPSAPLPAKDALTRYFEIVRQWPRYEPRPAQEAMIAEVSRCLKEARTLIVEAGTGSGKSFGYLIPALFHEKRDADGKKRPIVISTATIALQEQLLNQDIPFLQRAAGLEDLKVKLVKGRGNYLCLQKLAEVERSLAPNAAERLHLNLLKAEWAEGWDGDSGNLDLALPGSVWREVASDTEDCLGRRCRFFAENPFRLAREELDEADILVVNHALYLQDLA